ncbi:hypothetical protein E2R51_06090 [Jeotgalibacillus sp. S-D1]|uniref:hypothetical protein n=1 Tax=Jeotgalibacillus sp. S-D1 TaxID=2552189 RepID=UPI00105A9289|nr:hypothetical protein [Jeotgalibacillus sp. S-D1]TDL35283.1 hypothetical protein E2R51_06090 [Jeotgalibacillus sp. S-D1]
MTIDTHNYVYGIEAAASILGLTEELVEHELNDHVISSNKIQSVHVFDRSQLFARRYHTINEQIKSLSIIYKSIPLFDDKLTVANGTQRQDVAGILAELERSVLSRGLRGNQEVRISYGGHIMNIPCDIRFYQDDMKVIFFK